MFIFAFEAFGSTKTISVLKLTGLGFWEKILIFAFEGLGSTKRSWALEDRYGGWIEHGLESYILMQLDLYNIRV
ncbi:hypothetical protein ACOSP7_014325 [Xanthoceras sorbifolium]